MTWGAFIAALTLNAGYNAALVAVGAALLGAAAGCAGAFVFLRGRALISDAAAHATLPGVCLAFMIMAAMGGDGRNLLGLTLGAAVSAGVGVLTVEWIARRTRLSEDAAIGAVLSVFFGLGVVLLTVIQSLSMGRQAGLEGFLLGSTAGMLFADAAAVAAGGAIIGAAFFLLRRPMLAAAFDAEFAASVGVNVALMDRLLLLLAMAAVVTGLKIVGLVLIVALLIIPAAAARFWTSRSHRAPVIAAGLGAVCCYVGACLSAAAPNAPTGPIIVLVCFAAFTASMLLAPDRGALAAAWRRLELRRRVHHRQGLLALALGQPIYEAYTLRLLRRGGLIRADGVPTDSGVAAAAKALLDERRWAMVRRMRQADAAAGRYDGLTPIDAVLTRDEISEIDRRLGPPQGAAHA